MSAVISAKGLSKHYGKSVAIDNISFDIPAGKTTDFQGLHRGRYSSSNGQFSKTF